MKFCPIAGRQIKRCVDCGICEQKETKRSIAKMEIDIKALESAIADAINHPSELLGVCLTVKEAQAVLALLKEQEAVEPIPPTDESDLWKCGNCNHQLFRCTHQRYCVMCGRAVKWE